jgi:hypothetical protein
MAADQVNLCNPPSTLQPLPRIRKEKPIFKSPRNLPQAKKKRADFSFLRFSFFFSFCNYLPHKQKLTKKPHQKNRLTSSLCCTEAITNHNHRTLLISATPERNTLLYLGLNPEPRTTKPPETQALVVVLVLVLVVNLSSLTKSQQ